MSVRPEYTRRQFCGLGLVTPLGHRSRRNKREHHRDTVLFRGALRIPEEVRDKAYESPVVRTTHRKIVVRIEDGPIVYVLRVVCGLTYLGEVVLTEAGRYRVHIWSAVDSQSAKAVEEIIAVDLNR